MPFKNKVLTPRGKLYTAILILVCIILAYLLLFHPPRAEAIKTMVVELGYPEGIYDGKIKMYRDADNVLVLEVDSVIFEIEDNDITIGGNILYRADGTDVAVQDGGTGKSSGTQYSIPYYNTTTSFAEIAIGTAGQVLKVNPTTNGYTWANDEGVFQQFVTVAKSGGDFTTIQAAINSITDATPSKPYVILVYPGVYSEQVTLTKSYVSIVGTQPAGVRMTEAQCSGSIITYSSSGVGDDIMTLWIKGGGTTDLKGITVANLTVINTQSLGVGGAQEALDIGRTDTYGRSHEILVTDCSFYGEQDTVFINTGNPTFRDCYIEGENDCTAIADDSLFIRTYHYCHTATTSRSNLWVGRIGGVPLTVTFIGSTFDIAASDSLRGVGHYGENGTTVNFYNCTILPYSASGTWYLAGKTGTMNLYNTNGTGWDPDANFLEQEGEVISGDSTVKGGSNIGTATGAASGQLKASDSGFFSKGLNVGSANDAAQNQLKLKESGGNYLTITPYSWGGSVITGNVPVFVEYNVKGIKFPGNSSQIYGAGLNVGDTGRAVAVGDIYAEGTTSSKAFDVQNYTGGLPAASASYRGQICFVEGSAGNTDAAYMCIKKSDDNYYWQLFVDESTP